MGHKISLKFCTTSQPSSPLNIVPNMAAISHFSHMSVWNLFFNLIFNLYLFRIMFFKYILVWPVPLAQVLPRPWLIFPSKTWLLGIYLNFQWQKSAKNQYFPHSESKSYHINSIKSCSSRFFQQHQRHIPILPEFSVTI
jgi:hypothetical protein